MVEENGKSVEKLTECLAVVIETKRQSLSMSQETLAQRAGLSRTYLSDIERGLRNISVITLRKIAAAMDTHASDLLSKAESKFFFTDPEPATAETKTARLML